MVANPQKVLVQESFAAVMPIADDAAALFYHRLFELDPSLERMFKGDMTEQRRKLVQMLTPAVKGLDRLDQLVPVVPGFSGPSTAFMSSVGMVVGSRNPSSGA